MPVKIFYIIRIILERHSDAIFYYAQDGLYVYIFKEAGSSRSTLIVNKFDSCPPSSTMRRMKRPYFVPKSIGTFFALIYHLGPTSTQVFLEDGSKAEIEYAVFL